MAVNIDWSQARGQGNAFAAALDGYQAGRALGADQAKQRATENALAAQTKASGQAATGDYKGAQTTAIGAGQFDLAKSIGELDSTQRAHVRQQADDFASFGYSLKSLPLEQRKAALEANKPLLVQRGMDPAQIDGFDPTDANIDLVVGSAMDLKTQLDNAHKKSVSDQAAAVAAEAARHNRATEARPVVMGPGAVALGAGGQPVYSNPKTFAPPRASSGGGQGPAAPSGAPAGAGGGPSGPKPRPDWGQGAVELPNGAIARIGPRGGMTILSQPQGATNIPQGVREKLAENAAGVEMIDQAIAEVDKTPSALGLKNAVPESIMQRMDPAGVAARAAVANIGSKIVHDRSGANVTISESPRLKPFIPNAMDSPEAVKKKLRGLQNQLRVMTTELSAQYGKPAPPTTTSGAASSPPTAALKAGQVTTFANGQKWTLANGKPVQVK